MTSLREQLAERGIELGEEVGQGAMAVVYRAGDPRHERLVAVKVFRPDPNVELGQDRFLQEIRVAAGLRHPNILPVYDSGVADGVPFYVMPFVAGKSLRERLVRVGRLPLDEALRLAREVADALGYSHAHGVVHRDIKPENILLDGGHAVVADFGIARTAAGADESPEKDSHFTTVGRVVGSPEYISPEQASGDTAVDGRSDIFSLGCVLYEMLAGEPPFHRPSVRATLASRFEGPPTPLHQRHPDVPPAVSAAVQKALAVDPAGRFDRAEDFAAALARPVHRRRFARRLAAAATGGMALAATALVLVRAVPGEAPRFDPRRVAVGALSNESGDSRLTPLGSLVSVRTTERLGHLAGVEVVTSATEVPAQHDQHTSPSALDGVEQLHALAAETRAGTLVSGSYY